MKITISEPIRLDILAKETMGTERNGALEALLSANPGLAEQGPFILAPKVIEIPKTPQQTIVPAVSPWE